MARNRIITGIVILVVLCLAVSVIGGLAITGKLGKTSFSAQAGSTPTPTTQAAISSNSGCAVQPAWPTDDPGRTKYYWDAVSCGYLPLTTPGNPTPALTAAPIVAGTPVVPAEPVVLKWSKDQILTVEGTTGDTIAKITVNGQTTEVKSGSQHTCQAFFASGYRKEATVEIELVNAAFAADGDVFKVGNTTLGIIDNPVDVIVFADQPGKYTLWGSSFGLCIAPLGPAGHLADNALIERRNNTANDKRAEYWLDPTGAAPKLVSAAQQ